jgi:hypothetical protein
MDFERDRVEIVTRPTNDISSSTSVNVQNIPAVTVNSGTITTVSTLTGGAAAEDAATTSNPIIVGGVVRAAIPPVTFIAGDAVRDTMTTGGAKLIMPYAVPEAYWNFTGALTTTSDVVVQTAAGTTLKRHVTWLQATNTGASAVDVLLRDGTTTRLQITIPAAQSVEFALPTGIVLTANTALNVALSAVGTVRVNLLGFTAP